MSKRITAGLAVLVLLAALSGCRTKSSRSKLQASLGYGKFKIAYISLTDGYWQLWTMDSDGSSQKQITKTAYDKRSPVWKSDDEIFFCTNNHKVYMTDLKGNEKQILKSFGQIGGVALSSADDEFVFVRIKDHSKNIYNLWTVRISPIG